MTARSACLALAVTTALCGAMVAGSWAGGGTPATWKTRLAVTDPKDLAGPRADGRFVLTAGGRLSLYDPRKNELQPFARGPHGYSSAADEPYIALPRRGFEGPGGCSYGRNAVYALEPGTNPGVVRISRRGVARRFASFSGFPSGIAFDTVGHFHHRLLVVVKGATSTPAVVLAFACDGTARTVAPDVPGVEGGMFVAPRSFPRFGGALIAANEFDGKVYGVGTRGGVRKVVESGIPAGPDIGVESIGLVPQLRRGGRALVADPGSDGVLTIGRSALNRAGVEPGELLISAEAQGMATVAIRCDRERRCDARQVATGPASAHSEGHLMFFRGG